MELLSKDLLRIITEHALERHSNVLPAALQVTRASKNGDSFAANVLRISVAIGPSSSSSKGISGGGDSDNNGSVSSTDNNR